MASTTSAVPHSAAARVKTNDVEIVYDTFGSPDYPPILLIMGLGNQMIGWRDEFCARLAAQGLWVIRFDNRDAGLSSRLDQAGKPQWINLLWACLRGKPLEAPYRLEEMANDVVGLLDALGIQSAHLVGVSLGGMIAQMVAIDHPQRVRTLILLMTSVLDLRLPLPRPKTWIVFQSVAKGYAGAMEHTIKLRRALRGSGFPFDEQAVRDYARALYARSREPSGTARQWAAILASASRLRAGAKTIQAPTLVIHGSADPLVPVKHAIFTGRVIPGAKLEIIEGLGHELPAVIWPHLIDQIVRQVRQ
jgi:pimeloyl-ACP methyl ester carboxylesterase